MKKLFYFFTAAIFLLGGFLFGVSAQAADIIISQDTTWSAGEIKIFNPGDNLVIEPPATLTISGGVILKMGQDSVIAVAGKLRLEGASDKPVVITSLQDDSFGGDSNADGSATAPAKGDWGGIIINSATADLPEFTADYAVIKYAGGYQGNPFNYFQVINAAKFQINHSDLLDNDQFLYILSANSASINNSNIYNPTQPIWYQRDYYISYGIYSESPLTIDVKNNYWGSPDGPTTLADVYVGRIKGSVLYHGKFDYQPFAVSAWPLLQLKPTKPNPVIIIPGILGSWQIGNDWQIDPIRHTYDNLIEALTQAGYKLTGADKNLFLFPYDWKMNNLLTADLLKDKIAEVEDLTGSKKVDIVAHSMGGLVARAYIEDNDYNNDVGKLIFLGTPHWGAPKSYPTYEAGEFTGDWALLYKYFFQIYALANGYTDLVKYIREQVPTVEQLLPIYDYLKENANGVWQFRPYYENYPRNTFLEFLNLPDRLARLKQGAEITNIASGASLTNTGTVEFIKVVGDPNPNDNKWPDGEPENFNQNESAFEMGQGDGTVPFTSANGLNNVNVIEIANDEHDTLPTTQQQDIIEILTGKRPSNYYDNETLYSVKKWLILALFSPADFVITAPDGQKVGKDFLNNSAINEIAGAFYSGFDSEHLELIAIPNPMAGEYQLELAGVGAGGNYKLFVGLADDNNPAGNQEFIVDSAILAGKTDQFILDYRPGSTAPPSLEANVDFAKLKDLTETLYQAQEITKKLVYQHLINTFDLLEQKSEKFDKIENNKNIPRILSAFLKLRLQLLLTELDFYQHQNWISIKAKNILDSNINLLIYPIK